MTRVQDVLLCEWMSEMGHGAIVQPSFVSWPPQHPQLNTDPKIMIRTTSRALQRLLNIQKIRCLLHGHLRYEFSIGPKPPFCKHGWVHHCASVQEGTPSSSPWPLCIPWSDSTPHLVWILKPSHTPFLSAFLPFSYSYWNLAILWRHCLLWKLER